MRHELCDGTSTSLVGWWPLVSFLFGVVVGAAALWGFLEYREYAEASRTDPDDDEHIP